MTDAWRYWSAEVIARAVGCPVANVEANWPLIDAALTELNIADEPVCRAVIGTVAVETGSFLPIAEYGPEGPS